MTSSGAVPAGPVGRRDGRSRVYLRELCARLVESYFRAIESEVDRAYEVADRARREGYDPETHPEIPRAQDMAMRVEKLLAHLGIEGISAEIRDLARRMPREEVAVSIARRLARDPARGPVAARVDAALRVGLAILPRGSSSPRSRGSPRFTSVRVGTTPPTSSSTTPVRSARRAPRRRR